MLYAIRCIPYVCTYMIRGYKYIAYCSLLSTAPASSRTPLATSMAHMPLILLLSECSNRSISRRLLQRRISSPAKCRDLISLWRCVFYHASLLALWITRGCLFHSSCRAAPPLASSLSSVSAMHLVSYQLSLPPSLPHAQTYRGERRT